MDWPVVTTYRGQVYAQKHRQEIIQDLYKEKGLVGAGMVRWDLNKLSFIDKCSVNNWILINCPFTLMFLGNC